jgi:hypothetical protein
VQTGPILPRTNLIMLEAAAFGVQIAEAADEKAI